MNRIHAPDGTPLAYDAYEPSAPAGDQGPAVLFFHGWSDHAARWATLGALLRDAGFPAYLLDQRGHGRSGGRRAHLSRFSQLLGDLQAFRRAVRRRRDVPQVLFGQGFGGLVVLRYLETQPGEPPVAAIVANPWLAAGRRPAGWKRLAARFADLWPTLRTGADVDPRDLARDPAVAAAWRTDAHVHEAMTAGARAEVGWAQRAVLADHHRIESPLLVLLGGQDRCSDASLARGFAERLAAPVDVRVYPDAYHELLHDADRERVLADVVGFLRQTGSSDAVRRDE